MRQVPLWVTESEVKVPTDDISHHLRQGLVGHKSGLESCALLQDFTGHPASNRGTAVVQLARPRFDVSDEFLERGHWHAGGIDHQNVGNGGHRGDRRKVLFRIKRERFVQADVGRVR